MLRDFEKGDAGTPHVGCDGVRLPGDPFGSHVVRRPDKGICVPFGSELTADPEITELNLAVSAQQDVAGLDVSVDDLLAVEIGQAIQYSLGDFPKDFLPCSATEFLDFSVDGVQGSSLAELHGDADGGCGWLHESAVISADMLTGAVLIEPQFSENLLLDIWVRVRGDYLRR
jgi:hypothetical protein